MKIYISVTIEDDENKVSGLVDFLKRWGARNDGTNGTATPGTHADAHSGEQSQVPPGRPGTGSRGNDSGERPQEPKDGNDGSNGDAASGDPLARDVQQRVVDTLRAINQLWAEKPK